MARAPRGRLPVSSARQRGSRSTRRVPFGWRTLETTVYRGSGLIESRSPSRRVRKKVLASPRGCQFAYFEKERINVREPRFKCFRQDAWDCWVAKAVHGSRSADRTYSAEYPRPAGRPPDLESVLWRPGDGTSQASTSRPCGCPSAPETWLTLRRVRWRAQPVQVGSAPRQASKRWSCRAPRGSNRTSSPSSEYTPETDFKPSLLTYVRVGGVDEKFDSPPTCYRGV